MPRSAAQIQAEIDRLEAVMIAEDTDIQEAGADSGRAKRYDRTALEERLDKLYRMRDRATGADKMFVRGRVYGLR